MVKLLSLANNKQSWLDGPNIPGENDDPSAPGRWPGEKLGLPQAGAGALASVMRRVGGITFDWFICLFAATIVHRFTDQLGGVSTITFIVFLILGTLSVTFLARTPGQAVLGMGVARIDGPGRPGRLYSRVVPLIYSHSLFSLL